MTTRRLNRVSILAAVPRQRLKRLRQVAATVGGAAPAPKAASGSPKRVPNYLALGELARRWQEPAPTAPLPGDLSLCEMKVFSQNGEDGVLVEILRRIGVGERPSFVEFGIGNGSEGCCVFLADVLGWDGLYIEASATHFKKLSAKYAGHPGVRTISEWVTPENLDSLLDAQGVPEEPDVMSIDVDGVDWWIWRGMRRRPRVVIVEYNGNRPAGEAVTVPRDFSGEWDGTDYVGATLAAFEILGKARGYRLVHTDLTGLNAFFVREDADRLLPADERVPRRRANYNLTSGSHPADTTGRPWVTVTPELAEAGT